MRRANVISGIVLAVFGLLMLGIVIPWQIEPGPAGMMSPRLMPNLMMIIITALSILLVINNMRGDGNADVDETPPISRAELAALVKIGALFAVSIGLYLQVSPLAGAIALVVGALLLLGERRLWMIVAMPSALLLAIWFLFYKILGTAIV